MDKPVKIQVYLSTRVTLKSLGRKGESYDVVIRRLIKHYGETHPFEVSESIQELRDIEEEASGWMELGKFLAALAEEMTERELPVWVSRYVFDLVEAACMRIREI